MKKFCEFSREYAMKTSSFEKKKMKLLTEEQKESYENSKICYIYKEELEDKKYCKVRDHCHYTGEYRGAVHSICNLKYSVPKNVHIVFQNGSNYDNHFVIKESAKEFKKQFTCLGENTKNVYNLYSSNKKNSYNN